MHAFGKARIVVGVLTLLLNVAFGLFLMLDYIQQGANVHPEPYHGPIVISVFGPTALMVFLISLTAIIELCTRQKPIACLQTRFELSWIGTVVFLQYSAALFFTASYWFGFNCNAAEADGSCRTLNTIIFVTSWAIPFMTLVYLILFLVMTRRVARRDPSSDVWRTIVRDVDWAAKNRSFVDSDAMSIASWSNKEEAINTIKTLPAVRTKSQRSQRMQLSGKSGSITDNALRLDPYFPRPLSLLQNPYDEPNPPPPGLADDVNAPAPVMRTSSAPKPLQLSRSIRNSSSLRNGPRESVGAKSMASVYSVDSVAAPPLAVIPEIVRTSASTMSQSTYQSPIPTFVGGGKPKIWAAMATTQR